MPENDVKRIKDFSKNFIRKLRYDLISSGLDLESFVLIGVGGLGRLEQGQYSDVDLLFITSFDESVKPVLSFLWENNYEISYSVRSFDNIISHAKSDITFFTSILFSKYIIGNVDMYRNFLKIKREIIIDNKVKLLSNFIEKTKDIDYSNKEEIFLNQPDIKTSYGGLRTFQIIRWLIKCYPELSCIKELKCYKNAYESYFHLLALREEITGLFKRKINVITIDILEKVMVIKGSKTKGFAESFIKEVFTCFSNIYDLLLYVKDIFIEKFYKRRFSPINHLDDIFFDDNYTYIKKVNSVSSAIDFVYQSVKIGKKISYNSIVEIKNYMTNAEVKDEDIDKFHLHIKDLEIGLYDYFLYLDIIGFLSKVIPYYSEMVLRPQIDYYHDFTLSYHSLFMIKNLSEIFYRPNDIITTVAYSISKNNKVLLLYSIILHDVGKVIDGDHIVNNINIISEITKSLKISEEDRYIIEFLVINHLILSDTINTKDINEKTILSLVEKIEDKRKLDMLLLLTYLDINSVSRKKVPSFIVDKLIRLYLLCYDYFEKGKIEINRGAIVNKLSSKISPSILDILPDEYLYDVDDKDILNDISYIGKEIVLIDEYKGLKRIKYFGKDYKGLLLRIVLPITLNYLDIIDAGIYTLGNGTVIDYFLCNPISYVDDSIIKEKILSSIREDINIDIYKLLYNKLYATIKKEIYYIEPKVEVLEIEKNYFYVNVITRSFPGLLYFLLKFFLDNGFNIKKSKIHTVGIRAKDGFYIEGNCVDNLDIKLLSYIRDVSNKILK